MIFEPQEPLFARRDRVFDQRALLDVQPAAFGRVERPAVGGAAGDDPQGEAAPLAAQIPERGVDCRQRERRDRADGRCVGGVFEFAPDRLDPLGVLADQARGEMVGDEAHHRRPAGPDRVAVAGPDRAVGVGDRDDRRLLRDEALDRVGALDLGRDVDQPHLDPLDQRHVILLSPRSTARRRVEKRCALARSKETAICLARFERHRIEHARDPVAAAEGDEDQGLVAKRLGHGNGKLALNDLVSRGGRQAVAGRVDVVRPHAEGDMPVGERGVPERSGTGSQSPPGKTILPSAISRRRGSWSASR